MGSLSGSVTTVTTTIDLTSAGPTDWIKWQSTAALNRKSGGGSLISTYTLLGMGISALDYTNDPRTIAWSDGTPTASGSDQNGVYTLTPSLAGYGFSWTVPADTTSRIVRLYVGGYQSTGTLLAHLSDSSATDYTNTGGDGAAAYDRNYELTYTANSGGQTLTLTWTVATGVGNVTLNAAALDDGGGGPTPWGPLLGLQNNRLVVSQ